jgi:hypothetical protein
MRDFIAKNTAEQIRQGNIQHSSRLASMPPVVDSVMDTEIAAVARLYNGTRETRCRLHAPRWGDSRMMVPFSSGSQMRAEWSRPPTAIVSLV